MAVPHLPSISNQQLEAGREADRRPGQAGERAESVKRKHTKSVSFSNVKLGSLLHQPQPGDFYSTSRYSNKPRPLGLIPGKNDKLIALKKLHQLLSPWRPEPMIYKPTGGTSLPYIDSGMAPPIFIGMATAPHLRSRNRHQAEVRYRRQLLLAQEANLIYAKKDESEDTPRNLSEKDDTTLHYSKTRDTDPDYMELTDKTISKYCEPSIHMAMSSHHHKSHTLTDKTEYTRENKPQDKKKTWKRFSDPPKSALQYFNFTGQAHLNQRRMTEDRRQAADHELCERCRLRGTRCTRCIALRTGGGYIIVDCDESGEPLTRRNMEGPGGEWQLRDFGLTNQRSSRGSRQQGALEEEEERRSRRLSGSNSGGDSKGVQGAGDDLDASLERDSWENAAWKPRGADGREGVGGTLSHGNRGQWSGKDGEDRLHVSSGEGLDGRGQHSRGSAGGQMAGGQHRTEATESDSSATWDDSGRQSHASHGGVASRSGSRLLSARSRPGSTRGGSGRPTSAMKKYRRGLEHKDHSGEKAYGQRQGEGTSSEGGGARKRHNYSRGGGGAAGDEIEDDGEGQERSDTAYQMGGDKEEEGSRHGYRGNLMKYKRKDDVKALHATLKELQGIDPLDYLARYCIIDQTKLPHYRHVFENVDRDEDEEISISELDFALKAVNYDLITDAEMNYVHSVLELAGRYRLNFQLFSLVAALSEKVVSLEDMVKRLINKMDFHALEVKMKKCKELFYLLADSDAVHEEGGVVTTASLGVELQAGGLTQEHVDYVVDRLNHDDKGFVEFLDYLTYVPLFVEIHDAIYGNPLDFSRTK